MLRDPCSLFGLRLCEIRKSKGWSQERLATESGLARSYVGGVERGQRNIALRNICKLANALGLSPSTLMLLPVRDASIAISSELNRQNDPDLTD